MRAMRLSRPEPVETFPLAEANKVLRMLKESKLEAAAVLRVGS